MTKLNRKLWTGLLIPIVMTVAGIVGGIEWVFASLGAMVLIGMAAIGIYVLIKVLQRSDTSLKGGCPECSSTSTAAFNGKDLKYATYSKLAEARPISKKDKRLIMEHIDELFEIGRGESREKSAEARTISKEDKRLLMAHVDEFFAKGLGQSRGMLS